MKKDLFQKHLIFDYTPYSRIPHEEGMDGIHHQAWAQNLNHPIRLEFTPTCYNVHIHLVLFNRRPAREPKVHMVSQQIVISM